MEAHHVRARGTDGPLDGASRIPMMLLGPAIWNGYPLLQWDTGGYLARWYEGYLVPSRSTVFGLYLHFGEGSSILDRSRHPGAGDAVDPADDAARARHAATVPPDRDQHHAGPWHALPWLASMLLTDIFTGLSVLALFILVLHGGKTSRIGEMPAVGLHRFAAATHSATLAVLLGLCCLGWIARPLLRPRIAASGLVQGSLSLVAGAAHVVIGEFCAVGRGGMDAGRLWRRLRADAAGWHRQAVPAR